VCIMFNLIAKRNRLLWLWRLASFLSLSFLPGLGLAQVTIVVTKVPVNTPADASIYMVGSFNDWDPVNEGSKLKKLPNGTYAITLPEGVTSFEYKFTRGSWESVEGSVTGHQIANRTFNLGKHASKTFYTEIKSWEDLEIRGNVTFVLEKVPENTPHDASIYIAGNFNDWNQGDPYFKMVLQPDGTYAITVPTHLDTIEFKFTRGNWGSVECRSNGRDVFNRTHIRANNQPVLIKSEIEAWRDLVSGSSKVYMFILLMAAFQGIFLIIAISGLPNTNRRANQILSILIFLMAVSLIGRVSTYDKEFFNFEPKLLLISDLIYFLFGPVFLIYIQTLLTEQKRNDYRKLFHFIPAVIQLSIYLPLFILPRETFINNVTEQKYYFLFGLMGGIALLYNCYYWWKCNQMLRSYNESLSNTQSFDSNLDYLKTFIKLTAVCLAIWAFSYAVYAFALVLEFNPRWINETSTDVLWVVFSIFTYFLGYFAMTQPEIFRLAPEEVEAVEGEKQKYATMAKDNLDGMKEELYELMASDKPYLNPKLSLQELAEMMDTNIHTISRLINEGYEKNFYDFINEYRIEEFKKLVASDQFKNHTFLAIAFEVGFSSKTTFNRAFKKSTGKTPREYFNLIQEGELEGIE
jgi:AraC-like DNA-binding protein